MPDLTCIACGLPFQPWQRITAGTRHAACNPEVIEAERRALQPGPPSLEGEPAGRGAADGGDQR